MKKVLMLILLSMNVISYSKSILDHDFGFNDCNTWTQKQIDDMERNYGKNGKDPIVMKNYDYHKKFKNKWDQMVGWWTDGTVVVNIEYKDGYYCYMLYKNRYYLQMNLDKIFENDTTLRKDKINKFKQIDPNMTINDIKLRIDKSSKVAREEYDILKSDAPIYTYENFYRLMSDEEGDLWRSEYVIFWKTPAEMWNMGHILYVNAFTLTKDGKLFLKAEDKDYISHEQFVKMFGKESDYEYFEDYTMYESKKAYIDYQFLANPLRKMTNDEIKKFKRKNIYHEKSVLNTKSYSKPVWEWNPYYFDGATKTRVR